MIKWSNKRNRGDESSAIYKKAIRVIGLIGSTNMGIRIDVIFRQVSSKVGSNRWNITHLVWEIAHSMLDRAGRPAYMVLIRILLTKDPSVASALPRVRLLSGRLKT